MTFKSVKPQISTFQRCFIHFFWSSVLVVYCLTLWKKENSIDEMNCRYLRNKINPEEKDRFHFFNSFFFRKLADLDKDPTRACEGRAAFQRVRRWTTKVNFFGKDFIFIPVNFRLEAVIEPSYMLKLLWYSSPLWFFFLWQSPLEFDSHLSPWRGCYL